MLQKLIISNYAIIDDLTVEFSPGLNIITGETGAGKSIVMGALGLILGDRAESGVLLNRERKCMVEGCFYVKDNNAVSSFLTACELDIADELLIRREIAVNGKSRTFINDTPVTLAQLKQLSGIMVDLHQQFDTMELGDNHFQLEVLDAMADNAETLKKYRTAYADYAASCAQLEALRLQQKEAAAMFEYHQFLFNELEEAAFKENELEELDAELKLLSHAEEVKQELNAIDYILSEGESPLIPQLKGLSGKLHSLQQYHSGLGELSSRLQSVQLELNDIAEDIQRAGAGIQHDPERMQLVSDKIALGYKLLKKHHATTTAELLAIKNDLQQKLETVINIDEQIVSKEKDTTKLFQHCSKIAAAISVNRNKIALPFATTINKLLVKVGMPNARIQLSIAAKEMDASGVDKIDFLFDANKTNRFEPISKVASGGELSRLMLCIKSVVASKLHMPTMIFDEIDTGISGEAAKQVGILLQELSALHQVIVITHQPQIAARASAHYYVYKEGAAGKISTGIRLLNRDERVAAVARMLGGEKPSAITLQNAAEMIEAKN